MKSDFLYYKDIIKKSAFEKTYYDMQNIIDLLYINNELFNFIHIKYLNYKVKWLFLYIILKIENISSSIIKLLPFFSKKKENNAFVFSRLWNRKKAWVQVNIITSRPLRSYIEDYLLKFLKKRNKNRFFFIENKINNKIIGGLIIHIEDKEWDFSLEESIRKLRIHLKYHNKINASY